MTRSDREASMEASYAPVAIFAYRRADHLRAMFSTLVECDEFRHTDVTIFVDGPKSPEDTADVQEVRDFVLGIKLPNVTPVIGEVNKGLRNSIFEGVSDLTKRYGRVIVFEDDLVLSPVTLTYFNAALNRYASNSRVWSICAYMNDIPALRTRKDYCFLPFSSSWGWATWERSWSNFDLADEIREQDLKSQAFQSQFDMFGAVRFTEMLRLSLGKYINSWAIRFNYKIVLEGGLCLFPPITYVRNQGLSGKGGTHGGRFSPQALLVGDGVVSKSMYEFPDQIYPDFDIMDQFKNSWESRVRRFITWGGAIKRRIRKFL